MAENYEVGKTYYMPVNVCVDKCDGSEFPIVIEFDDGENKIFNSVKDEHGILLTAHEIAADIHYRRNKEKDDRLEEMGGEIKVLKSENERLSKQNEELGAKVDNLEVELNNARAAIDLLQEENNKLKREVENRTTDYKLMRDNNSVYLSRIAIRNEVIDALVEKIRRLQGEG